ncbi:MAG: hypothetical protein L3J12_09075 [Spirochaetales bacterium]|nr:hypothetical protein [Spirochaetales bacterium]
MKRRILITGIDSGLKAKLIKQFLESDFKVAATVNISQKKNKSGNSSFIEIPWNCRSPLSAKNVILECLTKMDGFDEALTIFSSEQNNKPIHEISS